MSTSHAAYPHPGPLPQAGEGEERAQMDKDSVDWARVRADFPLLQRQVHGKPLVYLDSANTGQKPAVVIEAVDDFYRLRNANVSRAVHQLGSEATEAFEGTRTKLAAFVNVHRDELVLCSGTTFAINLVAYSWALPRLQPGDAILLTRMEHHANIVPWQLVAERTGATIKVVELTPEGALDLDALHAAMTPEVKLLAFAHVSNVLGTVNPVQAICREARRRGIATLIDGSQAVPHRPVDIKAIGCDFYAFTGHKMCGPTGTGALWARKEHLAAMPPFIGGGEMIREVRFDGTVFNDPPHKFEAGTPNIAGFVGLGAAVDYLAGARHGQCRSARKRIACPCHRGAGQGGWPAHPRHGARQGGRDRVCRRGCACARSRHPARPGRRRDPLRPALCASAAAGLRRCRDLPCVAGVLQHA